jgi:uncharacterized protein (DUF433 family)
MSQAAQPDESLKNLESRITTDPAMCGGKPCIRGMRIRVADVLDLLASGFSTQQVLEELPRVTEEDVRACLVYASRRVDHPTLRVA